jgi:hypothetical protein
MSDSLCSGCEKPMDDEAGPRQPCPGCGSTRRTANVSVTLSAQVSVHLLTKTKHRDGGKSVVREVTEGDSYHRKTGKWNLMHRLIDWGNDWYHERIRDGQTGEVVHENSEPLSEHWGHGSAKRVNAENGLKAKGK